MIRSPTNYLPGAGFEPPSSWSISGVASITGVIVQICGVQCDASIHIHNV
jgi:hypothetical protein